MSKGKFQYWLLPAISSLCHPRPQFRSSGHSILFGVAPAIIIPLPSIQSQMELRNRVFSKNLPQSQREERVVLR